MKFSEALETKPKGKAKPPAKAKAQVFDLEGAKKQFAWVHGELDRIHAEAIELVVDSSESAKVAVGLGGKVKELAKKIDSERDRLLEQPEGYVKSVKAFCKSFVERLVSNPRKTNPDCIETVLKKKVGDYQYKVELERREQERKAREEAKRLQEKLQREADEANRKAAEEAARKAEEEARAKKASEAEIEEARKKAEEEAAKNAIEAPTVTAPVVPKSDSVVRSETGASSHIRKTWKGTIVSPDEVPREYCSPDQKKINQAVKGGTRSIPGVNISEEIGTTFRT